MIGRRGLAFSDEFLALLIALDIREDTEDGQRLSGLFLGVGFDWDKLTKLLLRHRVLVPFCARIKARGLWDRIPLSQRSIFDEKVRQMQMRQLSGVGELIRISRALNVSGIEFLCLKGPVLSQLLYKDPVIRHFSDLDLFVRRADLCFSIEVLRQLGFRLSDLANIESRSEGDPLWTNLYHVHLSNEYVQVELHWRLSRNDRLSKIPVESLFYDKQAVSVGGEMLYTLGLSHLFEYLALHGASHCWNRLKWLLDGILLLDSHSDSVLNRSLSRPVQLLLFLRRRIEGEQMRRSFMLIVSDLCIKQLVATEEYPRAFSNMLRRTFVLISLTSGLRRKLSYLATLLVWPPAYDAVKLPRLLAFLYPLIGPVLWGREQLRMLFRKSGG